MKQYLTEVQSLQKIAGIKSEMEMPSIDQSRFNNKEDIPGESEIEEAVSDGDFAKRNAEFVKKEEEKAARYQKVWDSLKGLKFTHKNDRKKTIFTIKDVNYSKDANGNAVLSGYPKSWDFNVNVDWKGKKDPLGGYYRLSDAIANIKDGTWIPV